MGKMNSSIATIALASLFCWLPAVRGAVILSTWTGTGGSWTLANGNTVATGPNDNDAGVALLVSPGTFGNHTLTGKMWVDEFSRTDYGADYDDDFLGVAFGLQQPTTLGSHDYFLIDWKQLPQGAADAGFRFLRVDRPSAPDLFSVLDASYGVTVLGTNQGLILGWEPNVTYDWTLSLTPTNVKFAVKGGSGAFALGMTVFDIGGSFPDGRFAFATYSQPNNRFQLDSITAIDEPAAVVPEAASILVWMALSTIVVTMHAFVMKN